MVKTVACIIARTVSTRLPLKVLRLVDDQHSMLDFIVKRVKKCQNVDEVYICTSDDPKDEILEDVARLNGIKVYKGSADQPIERMVSVGDLTGADNVIRITGDDVFTATEYLDRQIELLNEHQLDYIRLVDAPLGASAEVMSVKSLKKCMGYMDPSVSEYLTLFIFEPEKYKCGVLQPFSTDLSNVNLTVDFPEDLVRTRAILNDYHGDNLSINTNEIVRIVAESKIPHANFEGGGTVKLPHNKVISYQEFLNDMNRRRDNSLIFKA